VSEGKLNRDTWPISPERVRQALRNLASESETECLSDRLVASQTPSVASADEIALTVALAERYAYAGELGRGGMGRVDAVFDRALGGPSRETTLLIAATRRCSAERRSARSVPSISWSTSARRGCAALHDARGLRSDLRQVLSDNETLDKPHLGRQLLGISVRCAWSLIIQPGRHHRDPSGEHHQWRVRRGVRARSVSTSRTSDIRGAERRVNLDAVGSSCTWRRSRRSVS
jgi:hypothetical protein